MQMINLSQWLKTVPGSIDANSVLANECQTHFSQGGEDIAIDLLLGSETVKGLFVDIGAYHPIRFSNTFTSYILGWRGINIDGNREVIEIFNSNRTEDINIHALVSDKEETLDFFRFAEGAWNTTNAAGAAELASRGRAENKIVAVEKIKTVPVMQILDQYVGDKKFDLLTIDVEGMDLRIVKAIDFKKYRPKVMALEISIDEWSAAPFQEFLSEIKYKVYTQCMNTVILKNIE